MKENKSRLVQVIVPEFIRICRKLLPFALFALLGSALLAAEYKDVVHLKNGSIVKGTIVENIPGDHIKIETSDGSTFVYKMREIAKFTKEKAGYGGGNAGYSGGAVSGETAAQYENQKKSPAIAVLLSGFLLPGAGHFYAGEVGWGLGYLSLEAGLFVSAFALGISTRTATSYSSSYNYSTSSYTTVPYSYNYSRVNEYFYVALITMGVIHIIDMIHAYYSVEGYNKSLRRKLGMPEFYAKNVNIQFFTTRNDSLPESNLGSASRTQYGMSFGISF